MKISPFQAVVLAIFAVAIVAGVIVLAMTKNSSQGTGAPITIWGTLPQSDFSDAIADLTQGNKGFKITYIQKEASGFDQELVEALAVGNGPDAILLPQDLIIRHRGKVLALPYESLPLRTFKDTFIQEGELYLDAGGVLALPFSVDPLLMYWNRDMLGNLGVSRPPQTWDEFIALVPQLTSLDQNQNIQKSGMALGEFRNVNNAKDIIAALFMQTGNPITKYGVAGLQNALYPATLGTVGALNFYTDFANPVKPDYSWNRALPNSRDMFAAGDLAFYFGFASEIERIRDKNPNLNFDVTYFPQPKGAATAITFGRMQALAVLRNSPHAADAFKVAVAVTAKGPLARWSKKTGLPPVRRDMLSADAADPYALVFYNSAVRARGWLDPNPLSSGALFQTMVESVTSGELAAGRAIDRAGQDLSALAR